jgi:hypothetical protein
LASGVDAPKSAADTSASAMPCIVFRGDRMGAARTRG